MTEGFFAIIIAIVTYLIYDNVAKKNTPDTRIDQVKSTKTQAKPKAAAETSKAKPVKATATKSKRTVAASAEAKPVRRKKTDA